MSNRRLKAKNFIPGGGSNGTAPTPPLFLDPRVEKTSIFREQKAAGWLVLNGNIADERELISAMAPQLLNPGHFDEEINKSRKVMLITAAFNRGKEHDDRHLIQYFEEIGINAQWEGAYPRNIQNLSIATMFSLFKKKEPWLYRKYHEKQQLLKALKREYYQKTYEAALEVTALKKQVQREFASLTLFDIYYFKKFLDSPEFFFFNLEHDEALIRHKDLSTLFCSPTTLEKCSRIVELVNHLRYRDEEIFNLLFELELFFLDKSGVQRSSLYKEQQAELRERILSSASIFIFGGRVFVLNNRLRFYGLAETIKKARRRGTNIYGISAGAICQTERFTLSFDREGSASEIFAADFGLGLLSNIKIFPHAEDIRYIRMAEQDELTFFTLRHSEKLVVGLSEKSVLLCEEYKDQLTDQIFKRYTSIGEEPVMIFGERGERVDLQKFDQICMQGCKFFSGFNTVQTRKEVEEFELLYRKNEFLPSLRSHEFLAQHKTCYPLATLAGIDEGTKDDHSGEDE